MISIPQLSILGWVHTGFSVIALVLGLLVVLRLLAARDGGTLVGPFIATAAITNLTAFGFFDRGFGIAQRLTILGTLLVVLTLLARFAFSRSGGWWRVEAVALVMSTWLLGFFTLSEAFIRVPALRALAPTLAEAPFRFTQLGALLTFVLIALMVSLRPPQRA